MCVCVLRGEPVRRFDGSVGGTLCDEIDWWNRGMEANREWCVGM